MRKKSEVKKSVVLVFFVNAEWFRVEMKERE